MSNQPRNTEPLRVLVAPDSFKGSLEAHEVAAHIAAGIRLALPGTEV
ncbi:MAG: Glycerate kinase family, partial [Massilia sp.]|nr:Glycerate kinase family [Massilia sp.]